MKKIDESVFRLVLPGQILKPGLENVDIVLAMSQTVLNFQLWEDGLQPMPVV